MRYRWAGVTVNRLWPGLGPLWDLVRAGLALTLFATAVAFYQSPLGHTDTTTCEVPPNLTTQNNRWLDTDRAPIAISHQGRVEPDDEITTLENFEEVYNHNVRFFETDLRLAQSEAHDGTWHLVADHRIWRPLPEGPTIDDLLNLFGDDVHWNFELKAPADALPLAANVLTCALKSHQDTLEDNENTIWDRTCVSFGLNSPTPGEIANALGNMCRCKTLDERWSPLDPIGAVSAHLRQIEDRYPDTGRSPDCTQHMYQPDFWSTGLEEITGTRGTTETHDATGTRELPVHVWHLLPRGHTADEIQDLCGHVQGVMIDNPSKLDIDEEGLLVCMPTGSVDSAEEPIQSAG